MSVRTSGQVGDQRAKPPSSCHAPKRAMQSGACSIAWGTTLAEETDPQLAAGILQGNDAELTAAEHAMAAWARRVARDPTGTRPGDVQELRDAGFSDADIFAMTVYIALRVALSTVDNALGPGRRVPREGARRGSGRRYLRPPHRCRSATRVVTAAQIPACG